jgi:hypothetical protein
MKKLVLTLLCLIGINYFADAQKYMQISTVESVVPGGLGRSRMITTDEKGNVKEEKMENFFSMVGINFGNINANDQMITQKLNELAAQGWEVVSVNSGVYSADKSTGIFITRYLLKKED